MKDEVKKETQGKGRFHIARELGRGSMGIVYEALDKERNVRVALKTLMHVTADGIYHLKKEFRSLQDIVHPNLCGLVEMVEQDGSLFLVMELIDGVDFLSYATLTRDRPDASQSDSKHLLSASPSRNKAPWRGFNDDCLRRALRDVVHGMSALHNAGKVHRDVKPTNVIVTKEGRAVLLDFGLIWETTELHKSTVEFCGTPEYMAPEQAELIDVGPAADWYSVGVMLYEALTGTLPFDGKPIEILINKQTQEPTPPSSRHPNVPPDLNRLCMALLRKDPKERPTAKEILSLFECELEPPDTLITNHTNVCWSGIKPEFVGRHEELAVLTKAFDDTVGGRGVTVVVEGVSGIGKSALVNKFISDLRLSHPQTVVLSGRCYEKESVPFKAFDAVMDSLARYIRNLPDAEAKRLIPSNITLLARLFPTLNRVGIIAGEMQSIHDILDPHEARRRAFRALGDLFALISEKIPLVVSIDDMQWTDPDSLLLLENILEEGHASPMLLLLSSRFLGKEKKSVLDWESTIPGDLRKVSLKTLDHESSEELARIYLNRSSPIKIDINAIDIANEAGGHPLYIAELSLHIAQVNEKDLGQFRLDDVILNRVRKHPPSARKILEISCVAGSPIRGSDLQELSEINEREFVKCVSILRVSNLLRSRGARKRDFIEPYHDRVREAVVTELIKQNKTADLHLKIGRFFRDKEALEGIGENLFEIVRHLNEVSNLLTDAKERRDLISLNFEAGKKARLAEAYLSAATHFQESRALAYDDLWRQDYKLCLDLYTESAEIGFLLRDQELMNRHCHIVIKNAGNLLDKVPVYEIMIKDAQSRGNVQYAVTLSLDILKQLGIPLPLKPGKLRVMSELLKTKRLLKSRTAEEILNAAPMTDPYKLRIAQLSARAGASIYFVSKDLMAINTLIRIRLSLQYGFAPASISAFAGYALICCGILRDFDEGYKYGKLALDLLEKHDLQQYRGSTLFRFNVFVRHWKEPIVNSLGPLQEAYRKCIEVGDLDTAAYPIFNYCYMCLFSGQSMNDHLHAIGEYTKELRDRKQKFGLRIALLFQQMADNVINKDSGQTELHGPYFDERELIPVYEKDSNLTSLCTAYCMKMFLSFLFEDYEKAYEAATLCTDYVNCVLSSYMEVLVYFYDSLVIGAVWDRLDGKERKAAKIRFKSNLKLLRSFAASSRANFGHKLLLVQAEQARIKNNDAMATSLYQQSIEEAIEHGFFNEAAIACELFGKFLLKRNQKIPAENFLNRAVEYYSLWGAYSKVNQLKSKYSELIAIEATKLVSASELD